MTSAGPGAGWLWTLGGLAAVAVIAVIALAVTVTGRRRAGRPGGGGRVWALAVVAVAAALAGAGAAAAAVNSPGPGLAGGREAACRVPPLTGHLVRVWLMDMGHGTGMMGGGPMMPGGWHGHGMMRVLLSQDQVAAGRVSLLAVNTGWRTHELVILPLAAGEPAGARPAGPEGTVSEAGSLGEASASCGAGAGRGIVAGSASWLTLRLRPGRYELICNLPGHYARGMYAELDVR